MTYLELYHKAGRLLDNNKITLGEYEKMIEPLEREISEWVPVSERLPEVETDVLVYDDAGEIQEEYKRLMLTAWGIMNTLTLPSGTGRGTLLTGCRCRARRRRSNEN